MMSTLQLKVASSIYNYLLYLPHHLKSRKWPLILFLHGAGEMSRSNAISELELVKKNGIPRIVEELPRNESRDSIFPFITVAPQTGFPRGYGWEPTLVKEFLDKLLLIHGDYVDRQRIYLTGISMGGFGTWATAAAYPDLFAAIIPICGGCRIGLAPKLKNLPIWNFHGKKDQIIPISQSELIVHALKRVGATDLNYTVYPNADHDSWTITYENQDIYVWLLEHKNAA